MPIVEKIKGKAKEVYGKGHGFVKEHPYKTAATFVTIAAVASLTAAYFLSPAYATFVGTVGTKAATLVSPAVTAMSAFAVAHPLIASLVVLAAVAGLIAAPVLAYKNGSKTEEIKTFNESIKQIKDTVYREDIEPLGKVDNLKKIQMLALVKTQI